MGSLTSPPTRHLRTEANELKLLDVKATALLKLIYLEMVGHDMSWASFHVLEVMSSAKYHQKRVGYLGAVQSFRTDTEVLMLATNLLKKVRFGRSFDNFTILTADAGLGRDFSDRHVPPNCSLTTRHHTLASTVDAGRPAPASQP